MEDNNILELSEIVKTYPGVRALDNVDFNLRAGEIHALVGQNGAGKSTLIEIIAGTIKPDSGQIMFDGKQYTSLQPATSIELGIQTVHQDSHLVDGLSVAENIFLHDLPTDKMGFVNHAACERAAAKLLEDLDINVSPGRPLGDLTFIEKKLVSLAKASSRKAKIMILDEPTASLDNEGKKILFNQIRKQTEKGCSIIYISHHIKEIYEICDRVTVLKDGKKVAVHRVEDVGQDEIIRQMIGRDTTTLYSRETSGISQDSDMLEVKDYHRQGVVDHVSFSIRKGEIFGLGGLVGAGRTELARLIFGLDQKESGEMRYCGEDITPLSPYDAINKGIGFLTEDRKSTGLVIERPIFENISMVQLAKELPTFLDLKKEQEDSREMVDKLTVKTPSSLQLVANLSGGNQQKVVLAKWLYAGSRVIIFDEPTVGIDVGAKSEIYKLMDDLASQGNIIIMISSDNRELISICDRVGVMREGQLAVILDGEDINQENLLSYSMGVRTQDGQTA